MATAAHRARTRQQKRGRSNKQDQRVFWVAAGVIVLLFGIAVVMTRPDGGSAGADVTQFRSVSLEGRPLPELTSDANDPAVGMPIPTFRAETFAGDPVNVTPDGRPKVLIFLAHWCPHCQADVRSLQGWLDGGGSAEGVDLYAVSTWADPAKPNFPQSEWLEREDWTTPTAVDDRESSLATGYGLSGTPMYVFIDEENIVKMRYSGELSIERFQVALERIRQSGVERRGRDRVGRDLGEDHLDVHHDRRMRECQCVPVHRIRCCERVEGDSRRGDQPEEHASRCSRLDTSQKQDPADNSARKQ